jgi:hypothetical protein
MKMKTSYKKEIKTLASQRHLLIIFWISFPQYFVTTHDIFQIELWLPLWPSSGLVFIAHSPHPGCD